MAISAKIELKQTQKQTLTQHLIQSIKLLQLSNMDLADKISSELLENPVLEEEKNIKSPSTDTNDKNEDEISGVTKELSGDESIFQRTEEKDQIYENFNESHYSRSSEDEKKRTFIENAITQEETLKDHLTWQAHIFVDNENDLILIENIITSLDDNGFLKIDHQEIAEQNNVNIVMAEKAISIINNLDPVGCGVKNIQDSLIVQAKTYYPEDKLLLEILKNHFNDFKKMQYKKIAKSNHSAIDDIVKKSKLVQNLNPYPGRNFGKKGIKYIIPDLDVKLIDDEIIVNMNDDWVPSIRINKYYNNILRKKSTDKKVKEYLKERIQSAKYLIESISNRRDTIIKVVTTIMEFQKVFLSKGTGHLRPLVYSDVAKETGLHESTISRVANNKYIQTSWGVFELKTFFVSKLKSRNVKEYSSDEIIKLIRNMINEENPENPITDNEILSKLAECNINIARRTIAKYRNQMNIPSSNIRKKINFINK